MSEWEGLQSNSNRWADVRRKELVANRTAYTLITKRQGEYQALFSELGVSQETATKLMSKMLDIAKLGSILDTASYEHKLARQEYLTLLSENLKPEDAEMLQQYERNRPVRNEMAGMSQVSPEGQAVVAAALVSLNEFSDGKLFLGPLDETLPQPAVGIEEVTLWLGEKIERVKRIKSRLLELTTDTLSVADQSALSEFYDRRIRQAELERREHVEIAPLMLEASRDEAKLEELKVRLGIPDPSNRGALPK